MYKITLSVPIFSFILFATLTIELLSGHKHEPPPNIFIQSQSRFYSFLRWDEIRSDEILFKYFLPASMTTVPHTNVTGNLFKWHALNDLNLTWRLEPSVIFNNYNNGAKEIINGTIALDLTPHLMIQNDFEFDSDGWDNPHFRQGQKAESVGKWTGYLQNSNLTYFYENGYILAGRGNLFSSIYSKSLLMNPDYPPAEFFWWHHQRNRLRYDWSLTLLNTVNEKNRFISLHRYGYQSNTWRIGLTEMVLVGFENLGVDQIRYIMPTAVFYETEINGGENANLMWAMDLLVKLKSMTLNGEILIDDVALDKKSPPKLGFKLGVGGTNHFVDYYFEYVRVNRWTGNRFEPELRYVENEVLIGWPLGPDSHSMTINFYKEWAPSFTGSVSLMWVEKGSGDINEWPEGINASSNFGWSSEPFPSSPIVTIFQSTTNFGYYYKNLNIEFDWTLSTNKQTLFKMSIYYAI